MTLNTELLAGTMKLAGLYKKYTHEAGKKFELTPAQTDVICFLRFNPGMDSAADIVRLRSMSKAGVSSAVDSLAGRGLLERVRDKDDRRVTHLILTAKALPAADEMGRQRKKLTDLIFDGLSDGEIREYLSLTGRILANIARLPQEDETNG